MMSGVYLVCLPPSPAWRPCHQQNCPILRSGNQGTQQTTQTRLPRPAQTGFRVGATRRLVRRRLRRLCREQVGVHPVTLRIEDQQGAGVEQSFEITVIPNPNAPVITTSPPSNIALVDQQYLYDVDATDPDDDALTYSLPTAPEGMSIDTASGVMTWTPTASQVGVNEVVVRVDDGGPVAATQSFSINAVLMSANRAPVINSSPNIVGKEGVLYIYDLDAADPDEDVLTFVLDLAPSGMTIDSNSGVINWVPDNTQVGNHNVLVRVQDGNGGITFENSFTRNQYGINIVMTPTVHEPRIDDEDES